MTEIDMPTEESPEDRDELVTTAMERAADYHSIMDSAKEWSRETATDLRVEAALAEDDETAEELEQVALIVTTVIQRIEQGDKKIARAIRR